MRAAVLGGAALTGPTFRAALRFFCRPGKAQPPPGKTLLKQLHRGINVDLIFGEDQRRVLEGGDR